MATIRFPISPKVRRAALMALAALFLALVFAYLLPKAFAFGKIYRSAGEVPKNSVGLVLGTSPYLADGRKNAFFEFRMSAAAELYRAGKVDCLLVSGDNGDVRYNESAAMQAALMKLGVPPERIVPDFAGFRTLDSVYRAAKIFGQNRFTVITQAFQADRALFFARAVSADAVAYAAPEPPFSSAPVTYLREIPARVLALYDVFVAGSGPRFLGDEVKIETDSSVRPVPAKVCYPR
jgi:SanA protein